MTNIIKLNKTISKDAENFEFPAPTNAIITEDIIWFNDNKQAVIRVFGTKQLRFINLSDIKYICLLNQFTGE